MPIPTHDGAAGRRSDRRRLQDHRGRRPAEDRNVRAHRGAAGRAEERVDPSSPSAANQLVADPHRRVFVVFLDTGGVGILGSHGIKEPLIDFLTRLLGPDDLVGIMLPHMSPDADHVRAEDGRHRGGPAPATGPGVAAKPACSTSRNELYESCFPAAPRRGACPTSARADGCAIPRTRRVRQLARLDPAYGSHSGRPDGRHRRHGRMGAVPPRRNADAPPEGIPSLASRRTHPGNAATGWRWTPRRAHHRIRSPTTTIKIGQACDDDADGARDDR